MRTDIFTLKMELTSDSLPEWLCHETELIRPGTIQWSARTFPTTKSLTLPTIVAIKGYEAAPGAHLLLSESTVRFVEGNNQWPPSSATRALFIPRVDRGYRGCSRDLFLDLASGPRMNADIALAMGCDEGAGNPGFCRH